MNSLLSWFSFFVDMTVIAVFVAAAVISSKRVGGVGPWLLACVGVIDGLLIVTFRLYRLFSTSPLGWQIDHTFQWLRLLDAVSMYGSGVLALVGLGLLMPKTRA